jgi:hypothetical protein
MTVDERIEKLTERHEALAQSVELLTNDVRELAAFGKVLSNDVLKLAAFGNDIAPGPARLLKTVEAHEHRIGPLEDRS